MDIKDKLIIGYSGFLDFYSPEIKSNPDSFIGTYRVDNVDSSTRSAYYLFKGLNVLKQKFPEVAEKILINLWGTIDRRTQHQANALGVDDMVLIEGYFSKAESLEKLTNCDVLFLPHEIGKNNTKPLFIPAKLYEYLSLRKPVLALVPDCDSADILNKSGLAKLVDPQDPDAISEALQFFLNQKNRLKDIFVPNEPYIMQFEFQLLTGRLANIFDNL